MNCNKTFKVSACLSIDDIFSSSNIKYGFVVKNDSFKHFIRSNLEMAIYFLWL